VIDLAAFDLNIAPPRVSPEDFTTHYHQPRRILRWWNRRPLRQIRVMLNNKDSAFCNLLAETICTGRQYTGDKFKITVRAYPPDIRELTISITDSITRGGVKIILYDIQKLTRGGRGGPEYNYYSSKASSPEDSRLQISVISDKLSTDREMNLLRLTLRRLGIMALRRKDHTILPNLTSKRYYPGEILRIYLPRESLSYELSSSIRNYYQSIVPIIPVGGATTTAVTSAEVERYLTSPTFRISGNSFYQGTILPSRSATTIVNTTF
jgi:hypothetical protein